MKLLLLLSVAKHGYPDSVVNIFMYSSKRKLTTHPKNLFHSTLTPKVRKLDEYTDQGEEVDA